MLTSHSQSLPLDKSWANLETLHSKHTLPQSHYLFYLHHIFEDFSFFMIYILIQWTKAYVFRWTTITIVNLHILRDKCSSEPYIKKRRLEHSSPFIGELFTWSLQMLLRQLQGQQVLWRSFPGHSIGLLVPIVCESTVLIIACWPSWRYVFNLIIHQTAITFYPL